MVKKISKPEQEEQEQKEVTPKKTIDQLVNEVPNLESKLQKKMDTKRKALQKRRSDKIQKIVSRKKGVSGKPTKRK